ncbi:C40 family peptidase [Streptomyces sp. NPDC053048]|uniref:C40 family peptidase n=1 Tax=Streptomyces sp. NPDC053048 TaxID=3365694 RepID=UPI0037D745E0
MGAHKRPSMLSRAGNVPLSVKSALTLAAVGATVLVPGATDAEAATLSTNALHIAASKAGSPYQWGATGPYRFDCSGLTQYSFKRAGKQLPRTAQDQYNRTRRIPGLSRERGDLVFFHGRGGVYHVGIYAGDNRIWHAPKTGSVVRLERIWTRSISYGRVNG